MCILCFSSLVIHRPYDRLYLISIYEKLWLNFTLIKCLIVVIIESIAPVCHELLIKSKCLIFKIIHYVFDKI